MGFFGPGDTDLSNEEEGFSRLKGERGPDFLVCSITGFASDTLIILAMGRPLPSISLFACFLEHEEWYKVV